MLRLVFLCLGFIFWGCSNLNSGYFSEGFYKEKALQLTRKATFLKDGKAQIIAFSTYLSELNPQEFPDEEVFFIEVVFENENIQPKDLSFSLFGKEPTQLLKLSKQDEERYRLYRHSPWSELFLVHFDLTLLIDSTNIVLKMLIKPEDEVLEFDYSYVVGDAF